MSLDVLDVLRAFGAKRVSQDDVMRALAGHDGWLAPAVAFGDGAVVDRIVMYGTETKLPPGELWLFTGEEKARAAQASGALLGAYAADLSAAKAMSVLHPGIPKIAINPVGPQEESWYMPGRAKGLVDVWIRAVAIEKRLGTGPDFAEMARYDGWSLTAQGNDLVGLNDVPGFQRTVLMFTTPDRMEVVLAQMPAQLRATLRPARGGGAPLFDMIAKQNFDSVLINRGFESAAFPLKSFVDALGSGGLTGGGNKSW